eukprot:1186207-Amphidinium_carterae.1
MELKAACSSILEDVLSGSHSSEQLILWIAIQSFVKVRSNRSTRTIGNHCLWVYFQPQSQ